MLRYDAPNAIAPDIGAPMFNIAPLGYPVFQGKTISLQYGHHYSNCLVKVGPGYSTAPECEDDFCASNTGNCTLPRCEPTDHVCCEDELNSEGVCCRLNPSHRSCDTPTTIPPTDMMRRICTNTPSSDVIIGCYDDDCDDYRIDDSSNVSYTTVSNPYLKHGGLIFATVDLNITDTPIPLYIRDGNGVISTRYLYWEGSDRARPNSEGFRYFRVDNGDVITSPEWTNSDVKLSINCQDDMGRGLIDTVFCGCDIPDEHEFEIEYGDKIINQGGVDRTVPNEDNVRFTRILSEREAGRLSIRDTGGNEASGSPYEYDVDWIDTQDPEITISTDHGPIASIDRAAISSTDIQIDIEDEISGIVAHDIKFGNPSVLIEAMNLNCNSGSARYPRTGDRDISIDQSGVQTNRAVFVCAKDAAGNITYKKFTFGGTRLINYYQGPVMGFSYSGELDVSDRQSYEKRLIDRVEDRRVEINDTYHARE